MSKSKNKHTPSLVKSNSFGLKNGTLPVLSLLASTSTLICCALPALLVSLGMGATLAGLVSNFPALIWLSKNKTPVFALAATLIILASLMMYKSKNMPCPADPEQAKACMRLRKISWTVLFIAIAIYSTGFFFAFLAPYILTK